MMSMITSDFATMNNANISYFVAYEGDETKPQSMLAGDRNISGPYNNSSCGLLNTVWTALGLGATTMATEIMPPVRSRQKFTTRSATSASATAAP